MNRVIYIQAVRNSFTILDWVVELGSCQPVTIRTWIPQSRNSRRSCRALCSRLRRLSCSDLLTWEHGRLKKHRTISVRKEQSEGTFLTFSQYPCRRSRGKYQWPAMERSPREWMTQNDAERKRDSHSLLQRTLSLLHQWATIMGEHSPHGCPTNHSKD